MKLKDHLLNLKADTDFHVIHSDEEHEVATICENPMFTCNAKFHEKFADVLNAEVLGFGEGAYGLEFGVDGEQVSAKQVEEFQFWLAGYYSADEWDEFHILEK